jgi:hypothetical protein
MNARVISFLCGVLLAGSGCSADLASLRQADGPVALVEALQKITVADLDAATARAVAGGDQMGAQCYPVLKKYVEQGLPGVQKFAGFVDAFEAARLGRKQFSSGVPDDLRIACAPLLMDEREFGLRVAAMAGAAGAAGGNPVAAGIVSKVLR